MEREDYSFFLAETISEVIMSTVRNVIEEGQKRQHNLQRLQKLIKQKEESGILQRKQYDRPSLDKAGRYFRQKTTLARRDSVPTQARGNQKKFKLFRALISERRVTRKIDLQIISHAL
jgi:Arc/MetJ-type ribon-helix-helix transcriptional regulator